MEAQPLSSRAMKSASIASRQEIGSFISSYHTAFVGVTKWMGR